MQYHYQMATSYVLDTDVIVAALRSDRGASRQLLMAALNQQFELLLSVPLILEYEAVLKSGASLMTWRRSRNRFSLPSAGGQGYPILMTIWCWKRQ
jgi:predicted nucleic acid-binding protein